MLPIKIKNEDFLLSDISLFSLVDKETQTESKCVSEQGSNAFDIDPNTTEQEVANLLEYYKNLSESGIFDTKVPIENIKQHKRGVVSAKSSHGTFLLGNIFQQEEPDASHSTAAPAWKLDASFDREFPNSGLIHIPNLDTEDSNRDNVPNNACVFIPNQPWLAVENNEEDTTKCNLIVKEHSSIHSKTSNEILSTCLIRTSIEQINIDTKGSKEEMSDKKPSNEEACSPSEMRRRRLNYIAEGVKRCLSTTLSTIMDPICNGACRSNNPKMGEMCPKDTAKEKNVQEIKPPIPDQTKPDPPQVAPKTGIVSKIKKSLSGLFCDPCPACEAKPSPKPASSEPPPEPKKEEPKKEEVKCSPNKFCGPVITHPCPPPPKPRNCGFDNESTQSLKCKAISPLINVISPNNEFVSEEYVLKNNDHPSIFLDMSANRNSDSVAISKRIVDVVTDLSTAASSIKEDDDIHSNAENILLMKDNTIDEGKIQTEKYSGPIAKIMNAVESTVASLKEHVDLDRITSIKTDVTKAQVKTIESRNPSSEYFIRAVAPEVISQSHPFVPPPRGLFTSFKSTIFRFFGEREKMEQPSDISSNSASEASSEITDESANEESDPQM